MTVTATEYVPEIYPFDRNIEVYTFTLETSGVDAIEVYYVDNNEVRTLASVDRYAVRLDGNPPIYDGGRVILTKPAPEGTVAIAVERNTPITQVLDWNTFDEFPMRSIEYAFDKATLIAQEIAYRKCDASVSTPMNQLISFDPYTPLYASEVNAGLDKILAILNEIAGTAESCKARPDET